MVWRLRGARGNLAPLSTNTERHMKQTKLAAALAVIGKGANELDNQATQVLRLVRAEKINDLKGWSAAVRAAYKANGWNGKPGKPKAGAKKALAVPGTVKQYVSAIRRAFRLKLPVSSYSSFYALRQDLKARTVKAAKRQAKVEAKQPLEMIGIKLRQPDTLNGAIFHDLTVLYQALDRSRKPKFIGALERIKREFSGSVPQLVVASLPELRAAGATH